MTTNNGGGYGHFANEDGTPVTPPPNDGPAPSTQSSLTWQDVKDKAGSLVQKGADLLDPSKARMAIAGLFSGGANSPKNNNSAPTVIGLGQNAPNAGYAQSAALDWRLRISVPYNSSMLYQSGGRDNQSRTLDILSPLNPQTGTDGVIFPYTPNITVAMNARYGEQALVHSNYKSYFYEGSDVAAITISGEFTAQNADEAKYVMAAIYFFRATTKMFFGEDTLAGNPPPMVFLNGYGDYYFPNVSCVVTNFTHTMPNDVDYIDAGYYGRVPTVSTISVTLQPVVSRKKATGFNHGNYASGGLIGSKYNGGGFL